MIILSSHDTDRVDTGSEWAARVVIIFEEVMSHNVIVSSADPLMRMLPLEVKLRQVMWWVCFRRILRQV